MGYLRGVMHGAVLGAALGLLYAPQTGTRTRRELSRWLAQAQQMLGTAPEPLASEASPAGPGRSPASRVDPRARRPAAEAE